MSIYSKQEAEIAKGLGDLAFTNPFGPERIKIEKRVLQKEFSGSGYAWSLRANLEAENNNIVKLKQLARPLVYGFRTRLLEQPSKASNEDFLIYQDLVGFVLYHRYRRQFTDMIRADLDGISTSTQEINFFHEFKADASYLYDLPKSGLPKIDFAHLFACFFQLQRAVQYIFHYIVGNSPVTSKLRETIWQSIFTHDMRRYYRSLYKRMGEVPTLITGPSGTGKELVARAIGYARYIPFLVRRQAFSEDFTQGFFPIHLAALSSQLIESELFGHKKGSFTGALEDHKGYFEECGILGTIFLDEIGEANEDIQVKLLRVLQTRQFQRLGETKIRQFQGKIVAATNRNLAAEMQAGRFREDFYYRLCADKIQTPTLKTQIEQGKDALFQLTLFLTNKIAGTHEATVLAKETETWIRKKLPKGYAWPGNIRELEQCIRNIMIHREYHPARSSPDNNNSNLGALVNSTQLTADELLERYCTLVYYNLKSYEATARHLKLDRRTVKNRIDSLFLTQLENQ